MLFQIVRNLFSIISFLFFFSFPSLAQIDKEFWFVAPEVSSNHGDSPIFLRISTFSQPAEIEISQPANSGFSPIKISIPANRTQSIDLTSFISLIENQPSNTVLRKGILLKSTAFVTAYYEVASNVNPEIFPLKGKNALGNLFYVPSQFSFVNQVGSESIEIVATENNTAVTITPTLNVIGHQANVPFTIQLQKGQTFSVRAFDATASASLSGTKITSDKPIAVTIADDSILLNTGYDLIGDQLIPVHLLGTDHIAIRGFSGFGEEVYVLAVQNGTQLRINGNLVATLNEKQSYRHKLNEQVVFIQVSSPAYVYHISGHPNELGSAIIPHIECTGSKQMGFVRTSSGAFALMILTQNGNQGSFSINGNTQLLTTSDFFVVPHTNQKWVATIKEFSASQIPVNQANLISNSKGLFHLGILNDLGGSSEYGYFSDYSSLDLGADMMSGCEGENVVLDAGAGKDSYLWSDGSTQQTLTVSQSGQYWVQVGNSDCILKDTITVNFEPLPVVEIQDLKAEYCVNDAPILLKGNPSGGVFSINGQVMTHLDPALWGEGEIEIHYLFTNYNNCTNTTTQKINILPLPILSFTNLNAGYCMQDAPFVLEATPTGGKFQINGMATNLFNPAELQDNIHQVTYTYSDAKGCTQTLTQEVEVVRLPEPMSLPSDSIFVCPANKNGTTLLATGGRLFKWSTGETTSSIQVRNAGKYQVEVSNGFGCSIMNEVEVFAQCAPVFYLPSAFSPNNDGLNDQLLIFGKDIYNLELRIYNRWGEIVFVAQFKEDTWDGTLNGKDVPNGIYFWIATYQNLLKPSEKFKKQGKLTVVR